MDVSDLAYAYGEPPVSGVLREQLADFYVEEILGFEPEGDGEHVFLFIEKRGCNTQYVAEQLSRVAGVHPRQISFSGMKDRRAVTRQWFNVHLPGKSMPEWGPLDCDEITVLKVSRHPRKLRRGTHRANLFRLCLRHVEGNLEQLEARLAETGSAGVPNYFGEQRFGRNGANISSALRWFEGKFRPRKPQQGIYLSAARSWLFNELLSQRVTDKSWNRAVAGELLMLEGSHSVFASDDVDSLVERLHSGDIHPTGPMYGITDKLHCTAEAAALELAVLQNNPELCSGLESKGVKAQRRSLRVIPTQLQWQLLGGNSLEISFILPSGCFATAVMRELAQYRVVDTEQ